MNWKKGCLIFAAACGFPYVVTLGWTGSVSGREKVLEPDNPALASGRQIRLDREQATYMDVEQYLAGVVAKQIPADFHLEAIKAQAVIARTYIYRQMEGSMEIAESALDMDYLEQAQLERMWGTRNFMDFYQKVEQAVAETRGMAIKYEGEYIDAWFCRCSAGKTREGDENHPYLAARDCPEDVGMDDFLQLKEWTKEEFSRAVSQIPDGGPVSADQVPETIQIGERDASGYVLLVQIGDYTYSGDALRYALELHSPYFRFEGHEGNVRAEVKGMGHGYGMSQYAADRKAQEGWTFEEILKYFYQNITLVSE